METLPCWWVNTDRIDVKSDPDLRFVKSNLILGKEINVNGNQVDLSIDINNIKTVTKTFNKEDLIKAKNNHSISISDFSTLQNGYSINEVVYNITNNFTKSKYFNLIQDDLIISYPKFLHKNNQNKYRFYALIQEYIENPFKNNEKLIEHIKKIITCGNFESISYDELYVKYIDKFVNLNKNIFINFLSSSNICSYSMEYEEIKYFIQSFFVYNKYKTFVEKKIVDKEPKMLEKIYSALELLEIFGCSKILSNSKTENLIVPRFSFLLNLKFNSHNCSGAKFEIISFNRDIFDYQYTDINNERLFNIFHTLPLDLSQYNLLNKYTNPLIQDEENHKNILNLFNLLNFFKFSENEKNLIIQLINFILLLSNITFLSPDGKDIKIQNQDKIIEEIKNLLKIKKEITNFEKIFLNNFYNPAKIEKFENIEQCKYNLKCMIKDVYENIFYFVVRKINLVLQGESTSNDKQIIICNYSYQNKQTLSNIFDVFNYYFIEHSIKNFELNKISNNKKIEIKNEYDEINTKILNIFENKQNGLLKLLSRKEYKDDIRSQLKDNYDSNLDLIKIKNVDFDNNIFIRTLLLQNYVQSNANLIKLLSYFGDDTEIIQNFFIPRIMQNRNITNEVLNQYSEVLEDLPELGYLHNFEDKYQTYYIFQITDNFTKETDPNILRNNILKTLKKFKIKMFVEKIQPNSEENSAPVFDHKIYVDNLLKEVLLKDSHKYEVTSFDYKAYTDNLLNEILEKTPDRIISEYEERCESQNFSQHINEMNIIDNKLISDIEKISDRSSKRNDSNKKREEKKEMGEINSRNNQKEKQEKIERENIEKKLKIEKFEKIERVEMYERGEITERGERTERGEKTERVDKYDRNERFEKFDRNERSERTDRSERTERENMSIERNLSNNISSNMSNREMDFGFVSREKNSRMNFSVKEQTNEAQSLSIKSLLQEKQMAFRDDNEKIGKIQGAWRARRDSRIVQIMREKVFILQRSFRRYLIKKYDLPDNYFYNEKFLRIQHDKYERNFMDNMKILFPAIFNDILTNSLNEGERGNTRINTFVNKKLASTKNGNITLNSNLFNNNIQHSAYEDGKIHLFAKILDIDLMVETDEVYENLWAKSFNKVYSHCLKSNAPIQMLALGSAHTVCVNNKGRLFTFGWNNYGQCGVPINSTVISKDEIDNEYLVEMTEYNELKPRILNKVDGIKLPQIEEVIFTKNIACGEDHSLILDHEGSVWAFGLNLNGQLGLGHQKVIEKPTKIKSLSKHFITLVKSEGDINFAVSDKGEAFMWPWSDKYGNLMFDPIRLPLNTQTEKVTSVACGNNFALLLNNNGMIYSMGKSNNYGQLGHGDTLPRYRPTLIEFFQVNNERITQISCGYKHCVAKSSVGHAFTWGLGVKGQLGHGDFNNYTLPYQVKVETPLTKIYQVSAGFRSTYFLIENRKVYFCGCNGNVSMQNSPTQFITWEKVPELSNEANFSVVRIMNSWNKSFSIFYATIADTTTIKGVSAPKLNQILLNLATKCDTETVDVPYIEAIAKYFPSNYMKKTREIYIPRK